MSSQSMEYHSLPSLSDLKAYHQGKLSTDERSWIDSIINKNPLVAEVFRNAEATNSAAVQRVSISVSKKITNTYIPNRGFWSKYAGWIGLSSIALILGSIYFFNLENISPKYFAEQSKLNVELPQNNSSVSLVSDEDNREHHDSNEMIDSEHLASTGPVRERDNSENTKVNDLNPKKNSGISTLSSLEFSEEKKNEKSNKPDLKEPDNTMGFESNESNEKTGTVLLAVNSVNILSKLNPDDFNTRSSSSGGNDPLGRGNTKRQSNASYSMSDLPSYPGGDQALINYFKGELRPIKIPAAADKFDRSVLIELEVNSRGKLKDYKIFGNLHPTHQEQLEKAIKELPQFNKGKGEKVKYSLAISF
jgi:hypothetical protein